MMGAQSTLSASIPAAGSPLCVRALGKHHDHSEREKKGAVPGESNDDWGLKGFTQPQSV